MLYASFVTRRRLLTFLAALSACATRPVPPPPAPPAAPAKITAAAVLEDRAGDAADTAIEVPADAPDDGVDFENRWIFDRFGRFRRSGGGTGSLNGRRYDIVEIELPDGSRKKVYFDITENWKRWAER
jgi:hypothetical protein